MTRDGEMRLPSEEQNCHLVTVTEEEVQNSVRVVPRLDTLILVKAMGHRRRFGNPFRAGSPSPSASPVHSPLRVRTSAGHSGRRNDKEVHIPSLEALKL